MRAAAAGCKYDVTGGLVAELAVRDAAALAGNSCGRAVVAVEE
jgi:hypothetical protein